MSYNLLLWYETKTLPSVYTFSLRKLKTFYIILKTFRIMMTKLRLTNALIIG